MRGRFTALAVALACFGPYLSGQVRTEQVVIYPLAVIAVLFTGYRIWLPGRLQGAVAVWIIVAILSGIASLALGTSGSAALAGLDAMLLPVAAVIVAAASPRDKRLHALRGVAVVVIAAGVANTAVAWLQSTGQAPALLPEWLPGSETASGARAALQGRWTGALNQPALAGCFYSLGLLLATWRARRALTLTVVWAVLIFGGMLAGSKAFLWVGLPIALLHLLTARFGRGFMAAGVLAGASSVVFAYATGAIGEGIVGRVTGNRYGDQTSAGSVMARARQSLQDEPLGYGFAGTGRAVDSQWLQFIDFAGVLGIVGLAVVMICLVSGARRVADPSVRSLTVAIAALIVIASFAFPLLTGNRIAALLWLTMTLAFSLDGTPAPPPKMTARERRLEQDRERVRRALESSQPRAERPVRSLNP